ncbi:uncharacterized protein MONOS_15453 [Monocercomonoides exilis]|uniref:uncharacterized protein n=1 Tax=Monocercomonoides exilis TaxID=2049356 RepID=UPI00355A20F6|nr:hypothetical protein MONOS_15453 [Monocercomonoides exilis]|eukprot:MONOS_15453.1-p1 / transcript=MONOS_15453.1 / gene=MONOS_15453 / organism=Monocercomonoides_exilis_PA203 / gene_product=unspecified product / transcript_product=unspecified product / location=Mono_scaffold01237:3932-4202(+) / protein_length=70 / sequence_SO=supercontig / SO=protein_coding / is_pseudo=false
MGFVGRKERYLEEKKVCKDYSYKSHRIFFNECSMSMNEHGIWGKSIFGAFKKPGDNNWRVFGGMGRSKN